MLEKDFKELVKLINNYVDASIEYFWRDRQGANEVPLIKGEKDRAYRELNNKLESIQLKINTLLKDSN